MTSLPNALLQPTGPALSFPSSTHTPVPFSSVQMENGFTGSSNADYTAFWPSLPGVYLVKYVATFKETDSRYIEYGLYVDGFLAEGDGGSVVTAPGYLAAISGCAVLPVSQRYQPGVTLDIRQKETGGGSSSATRGIPTSLAFWRIGDYG